MNHLLNNFEHVLAELQCALIARRFQASNEPMRLNAKHFDIMEYIMQYGASTPSMLSNELSISRSSTSKCLKYLEEKDLVRRDISGTDGRSYKIVLTPAAHTILDNIYDGWRENARRASNVLTDQEIEQYSTISAKIIASLNNDTHRTI